MKRFCLLVILLLSYYQPAQAQNYYFQVPRVTLDVKVIPSAGAYLRYKMEFQNSPAGHAIDIVDIGMPNEDYSIGESRFWVNGQSGSGPIQVSEYVKPWGIEVHLGDLSIPPGGSGTFEFETFVADLAFQDTTRDDYASFQITPTWFGDEYVIGTTQLSIRITLPEGLNQDEVLHQDVAFTGKEVENGSVVVSFETERRFTSEYRVGLSFPKRVLERVVTMTTMELVMRWWRGLFSEKVRVYIAIAGAICLFIIYLRFTGGTGCIFFVPILIALGFLFVRHDGVEILLWPAVVILAVIVETARRRRKAKYLPAIASVEGGGIKRGLTAPEAGVLLEMPVNKVIALVLFGLMKKGAIRQKTKDPVMFRTEPKLPSDAILHAYEKDFLKVLKRNETRDSIGKIDFSSEIKSIVSSVATRMVGFDVEETREYYRHIISRAWKEAQVIGEVESWQKKMDEKVDWMMLDRDFDTRFQPYQSRYIPRSYRIATSSASGSPKTGGAPSSAGAPRFSDVAASVSGWFQNTAAGAVGSIEGQKGGIVDFGSVDKAIGKAMESSGRSSGGGGGGCACACAGCACACACAGGGR